MRKRASELIKAKRLAKEFGIYLSENGTTIRKTASHFDTSVSKVQRYIHELLPEEDCELYEKVKEILGANKRDRHLRGGEATYKKFKGE